VKYTQFEELLHSISHFVGFVLALVGTIFLLSSVHEYDKLFVATVYSLGLLLTYGSSTLYHLQTDLKLKLRFLTADHISIYLLIAGTYMPIVWFGVYTIDAAFILVSIWIITILAICTRYVYGEIPWFHFFLYLLLGFNFVFYYDQLTYIAIDSLRWIVIGGVLYTLGLVPYKFRVVRYNHLWWHILVLFASICHFIGVYIILT
jgi:hemolysin III